MNKKKKVAPLKPRILQSDSAALAFDVLNDVFGDCDNVVKTSADIGVDTPDEHENVDLIDLDDWTVPLMDEIGIKNESHGEVPIAPLLSERVIANKPTVHVSTFVQDTGKKSMFQSKEFEEDSILKIRFRQRNVPASSIRDLKAAMPIVPLSTAAKFSGAKSWFTFGVVTEYNVLRSSTGCRFDITDLAAEPCIVRVLCFNSVLEKMPLGSIVCIITPSKGKPFNGKDALIINKAEQLLLAGSSRDYGVCGARKKAGGLCGMVVNLNACRFCSYHAIHEFKNKMSRDLRSAQNGNLSNFSDITSSKKSSSRKRLMNSSKWNADLVKRDKAILDKLSKPSVSNINKLDDSSANSNVTKKPETTKLSFLKRKFDALQENSFQNSPKSNMKFSGSNPVMKFDTGNMSNPRPFHGINAILMSPNPVQQISAAKRRALAFAREKGGITPVIAKVKDATFMSDTSKPAEKWNVITPEFIALMTAKPNNPELLAEVQAKERDKRFDKLQMIEEVGEKLAKTHEVPVRVVRCLVCEKNYQKLPLECAQKNHKCRIVKGTRRYFECTKCRSRTSTLERLPVTECSKCGCGNWKRAGVAADRVCTNVHQLSVRGNEEKFMGSVVTDPNLGLLVPDEPPS